MAYYPKLEALSSSANEACYDASGTYIGCPWTEPPPVPAPAPASATVIPYPIGKTHTAADVAAVIAAKMAVWGLAVPTRPAPTAPSAPSTSSSIPSTPTPMTVSPPPLPVVDLPVNPAMDVQSAPWIPQIPESAPGPGSSRPSEPPVSKVILYGAGALTLWWLLRR